MVFKGVKRADSSFLEDNLGWLIVITLAAIIGFVMLGMLIKNGSVNINFLKNFYSFKR